MKQKKQAQHILQSDPDFSTVNFSTNPDYSTISWMTNFLLSKKPLILAFSQNCQTPILAQLIFNLFIGNYITWRSLYELLDLQISNFSLW